MLINRASAKLAPRPIYHRGISLGASNSFDARHYCDGGLIKT